jgi:hypothetical protein
VAGLAAHLTSDPQRMAPDPGTIPQQPLLALRAYVESFSETQLYSVIMNSSARTFYTRLLFKRISKLVEQKVISAFARQHLDRASEEIQGLLLAQRPAGRRDILFLWAHKLHETQLRLKAVVREAKAFRDCIKLGHKAGDLGSPALQVLREKLEALNEYYEDSYRDRKADEYRNFSALVGDSCSIVETFAGSYRDVSPQMPPQAVDTYPAHYLL